ncbi:type I-B CRISPR-associated protein Cas8b1/Cst1 [Clostridium sp. 3-3]|uniref:type I-B CRISPR-associated protein Cas8b1/Cst1 n=1 Tax=Clostridium sp. 3-3 TaxID=2070757 RepID=UPI000CDA23DF|nr:type I-B CRISPR-associated protein Cas8b1/Cst1 [Clostridium sp. 3-3]POO85229.1 type I-B CRISPR-associated protein Cas8b1/Cst1 [Clostridium sp. 3-3]
MAVVRVEVSDWLKNAGIVGFYNIMTFNDISGSKVKKKSSYIEFDTCHLDNFNELYFKYFINKYKDFISVNKITCREEWIRDLLNKDIDEKEFEKFNVYIKYTKDRLKSASYVSAYEIIADEFDVIKECEQLKEIKLKKKENISDVKDKINEECSILLKLIDYINKPEVKKIIAAKNVIYDVIQPFWSDVSFLNKNNNKSDMYNLYKGDFIDPVSSYIESDLKKAKYDCFTCENKIQKLSKPFAYDITWITKMGVDVNRKSSHFWNYNSISSICPICNIIYSCIPAGFSVINGSGLFINNNTSVSDLLSANSNILNAGTTLEELEEQSYFNIIDSMEEKSTEQAKREMENIQIVKFDKNNSSRPYTFNVLSKKRLLIVKRNKEIFKYLINKKALVYENKSDPRKNYYLNLYSEVLGKLYNGESLFELIGLLSNLLINGKYKNSYLVYLLVKLNNDCMEMRGGSKVYYKYIDKYKNYGINLKKSYGKEGENKIPGILYRLQNALKVKNQARFMDTLLNAYTSRKDNIPVDFVEALQDIDKFQTIGYAFLIGLQGVEVPENNKSDENKEKEGE